MTTPDNAQRDASDPYKAQAARFQWILSVSGNPYHAESVVAIGALGGTRTPNPLIRSQMLYPLSYERW
jgi:hypothetical protein